MMKMTSEQQQLHDFACDLLAARAMAGLKLNNPAGYREKTRRQKRDEYATKSAWLFANHPAPIEHFETLADLLEPPVPDPARDPTTAMLDAADAIARRNANRAKGTPDCALCDDTGIVFGDDTAARHCDCTRARSEADA